MKKLFLFSIFICGYAIAAGLDPVLDPVEEAEKDAREAAEQDARVEARGLAALRERQRERAADDAAGPERQIAERELAAVRQRTAASSIATRSAGRNRRADAALRERYEKAGSALKKDRAGKKSRPKTSPTRPSASRRRLW